MMNLNRSISHVLKASLLTAGLFLFTPTEAAAKTETFGVGTKHSSLTASLHHQAAEVHYPRIPRPYWEQRIKMCKALGMNTLCLYVFWNIHEQEEGKFDFTGNNDVAEFIRLAQENGSMSSCAPARTYAPNGKWAVCVVVVEEERHPSERTRPVLHGTLPYLRPETGRADRRLDH